jgi:hypothetical protein
MQADEPVDPKPQIEKDCHPSCKKEWTEYEMCKDRIAAKGTGNCEPWAMDYWRCIDKCVSAWMIAEELLPDGGMRCFIGVSCLLSAWMCVDIGDPRVWYSINAI